MTLRLRPHHFLCALGFEGEGYSDAFVANMARIVERLRGSEGDATLIEVAPLADDICTPCPSRRAVLCTSQHRIAALDRRHADALSLRPGDRVTWGDAKARIRAQVPPGSLGALCRGCQWLELGACEAALVRLHQHARPAGQNTI